MRPFLRPAVLIPVILGAAIAAWWALRAGVGALLGSLVGARSVLVLVALALTGVWAFLRFLRWQFMLRRVDARLPIRATLQTYLAALPGTVTPAYVGEIIRGVFVHRRFGVPMGLSILVLIVERLYDVLALALLALTVGWWLDVPRAAQIGAAFAVGASLGLAVVLGSSDRFGMRSDAMKSLRQWSSVMPTVALSLLAWGVAALLPVVAAAALGISLTAAIGVKAFTTSTLLGALTLLPAGFGATGSAAIVDLVGSGLTSDQAIQVVSLVRVTSTGAALTVGMICLWFELRRSTRERVPEGPAHFDAIAAEYNAQWSPHVWDLLLERKLGLMSATLPAPEAAGTGLDLGCGLGLQTAELRRRGFRVVGLDPSIGLLQAGQKRLGPSPVLAGSALTLPFADESLDFVYCIGVMHHLPGRQAQDVAIGEIARVLKRDGLFLVHESNPRNPLFRFYMGYLFPILKSIDEGTEWWIDPRRWSTAQGLRVEDVRYFTFLPDFTPRALMPIALRFERLLERGPTKEYSAHYMAVLRKRT